jgi:hypothetical protein
VGDQIPAGAAGGVPAIVVGVFDPADAQRLALLAEEVLPRL